MERGKPLVHRKPTVYSERKSWFPHYVRIELDPLPYHPNDEKSQNKRLRIAKHRMFDLYPKGAWPMKARHTEP